MIQEKVEVKVSNNIYTYTHVYALTKKNMCWNSMHTHMQHIVLRVLHIYIYIYIWFMMHACKHIIIYQAFSMYKATVRCVVCSVLFNSGQHVAQDIIVIIAFPYTATIIHLDEWLDHKHIFTDEQMQQPINWSTCRLSTCSILSAPLF